MCWLKELIVFGLLITGYHNVDAFLDFTVDPNLINMEQQFSIKLIKAIANQYFDKSVAVDVLHSFDSVLLAYILSDKITRDQVQNALKLPNNIKNEFLFERYHASLVDIEHKIGGIGSGYDSVFTLQAGRNLTLSECARKSFHTSQIPIVQKEIYEPVLHFLSQASFVANLDCSAKELSNEIFHVNLDTSRFINMISGRHYYKFAHVQELSSKVLQIEFHENENLEIAYVLPDRLETDVKDMLKNLNTFTLDLLFESTDVYNVKYKLPKFSIENDINLSEAYASMGLDDIATNQADVSEYVQQGEAKLNLINQTISISVNEGLRNVPLIDRKRIVKPAVFYANRPFLFLVYVKQTNLILLAGTYRGPSV